MNNGNTVNKPMTMVRQEVIESIANTINDSGLPLFVIEPILKDLLDEVKIGVKKQYELEKNYYEKLLEDSKKDDIVVANENSNS